MGVTEKQRIKTKRRRYSTCLIKERIKRKQGNPTEEKIPLSRKRHLKAGHKARLFPGNDFIKDSFLI